MWSQAFIFFDFENARKLKCRHWEIDVWNPRNNNEDDCSCAACDGALLPDFETEQREPGTLFRNTRVRHHNWPGHETLVARSQPHPQLPNWLQLRLPNQTQFANWYHHTLVSQIRAQKIVLIIILLITLLILSRYKEIKYNMTLSGISK
jgi:hypothetical protein